MGMGLGSSIPPRAQGWLRSPAPPCAWLEAARAKPGGGCTTTPEHPGALGTRPPSPPQKAPAAGAVQRAGAVQAVTASLLCREQREAGFKADLLKLFF